MSQGKFDKKLILKNLKTKCKKLFLDIYVLEIVSTSRKRVIHHGTLWTKVTFRYNLIHFYAGLASYHKLN